MQVFYTTLIVTFILGLITRLTSNKYKYIKYFFVFVIAAIFVGVAGSRTGIGDTYFYKHTYELLAQNPVLPEDGKDIGFVIFQLILIAISSDPQFLVFMTSLITQTCNIFTLYKYHNYFELQLFMYITSGFWLTTMNGIRQAMAASILFIATPLIIKGKFKWYCLLVVLLSVFHESALIMIPIYFFVREEPWSKRMMKLIGLLFVGLILYDVLEPIIFGALENTQYGHYSEFDEGGSSLIRTIIGLLPVVGAYLFKDKIREEWPEGKIFVNMALVNGIILCFSLYNWIFARLTYYFQPYAFVLLPYILMQWPNLKQKRLLYYGFLVCYFIFMYFEQVIQGLGMGYKSVISWF